MRVEGGGDRDKFYFLNCFRYSILKTMGDTSGCDLDDSIADFGGGWGDIGLGGPDL